METWIKSFLEVVPGILKICAEILLLLGALKGVQIYKKRKEKNKDNAKTASDTLIDVDKLMQTYADNMRRASEDLEEARNSTTECKKQNRILLDEKYKLTHELNLKNVHIAATIQLINAHIEHCDYTVGDLKEFVVLLENSKGIAQFMQDFKGIAQRHGLYKP